MKRFTLSAWLILVVAVGLFLPRPASAIPVFARKYGFDCTMCHSNMPRLNDFGQRYRMNGYQLPGMESLEKTVLDSPAPIALRTSAGYTGTMFNDAAEEANESDFRLNGLDLLSAGQLGRNIGYFMVYVPQIAEARGVAGQDGTLEMASVVFSNVASTWLNVRVGRFEPAFVPFSVKRQLTVSSYEIYDYSFLEGPAFSETQSGIEISGYRFRGFQYAAGLVGGGATNESIDSPGDVYLRLATVLGAGEGQTAGHRIGVVGYLGKSRPSASTGEENLRASFSRVGADASLNLGHANLALQYLFSSDDKSLWGADDNVTWSGGFAELSLMPRTDLVGFLRGDFVSAPDIDDHNIMKITAGGRYYFESNVVLHGEFSSRTVGSSSEGIDDAAESVVTARVDFAF